MRLEVGIAITHLAGRKRQTLVSLGGIVLGVGFFLAVSALMRGSERDFLSRLVDNSPHITVYDEYRGASPQPAALAWPGGAVAVSNVKPRSEVRGIRGYQQKLAFVESLPGVLAAPILSGAAVLTFAGRIQGVTLSGVVPAKMRVVSSLTEKFEEGSLDALAANPNGIVIGRGLARKFTLRLGDNLNVATPDGGLRVMRIVGIFRTGNSKYDEEQTYVLLKRAQVLLNRPNRVNLFVLHTRDPYAARAVASVIERRIGYKTVSWIEASEDIMNTLTVRNTIMYSVVAAILVVASFGIYNTISTIVMEKTRDIAILKSMGFEAGDIRTIFLAEGVIVGAIGSVLGVLAGLGLMWLLEQVTLKPPGASDIVHLPVDRGLEQFVLAVCFALVSTVGASYLPARKAGRVHPVEILRGAA